MALLSEIGRLAFAVVEPERYEQVLKEADGLSRQQLRDGVIEEAMFEDVNFDANAGCVPGAPGMAWQAIPETVPLPHAVNITRIYTGPHFSIRVLRLRSDGVVEQNDQLSGVWCGWRTPPE